jgi:hypothetical protein
MSDIGTCCRISAKMLEIADPDRPDLQKHNRGQAGLLLKAADMADEQEELMADLLAALKDLVQASDGHPGSVTQRAQARATIAKAEDRDEDREILDDAARHEEGRS